MDYKAEQISNFVVHNMSQISHYQRKELQIGTVGGWNDPCGVGSEWEVLAFNV